MKYHQKKTIILKILDKLPSDLGYFIYHIIQKRSFRNIDSNVISANNKSINKIKVVLNNKKINIRDQIVIEIGSGWLPIIPFLLKKEFGVSKVITYDINKHYNKKRILLTKEYFKFSNYKDRKFSGLVLPDFIEYYPNTNIINARLEKNVKLIYSRFVLEHINPIDIKNIHKKFYAECNNDIKILHLISNSDHRAYSDKTLSEYDFLQYSDKEWNRIQTKFDYHNRLRLPEYLEIFRDAGFQISYLKFDTALKESEKYLKYKQVKLHPYYERFNEKEILAGSILVLLEKPKL